MDLLWEGGGGEGEEEVWEERGQEGRRSERTLG